MFVPAPRSESPSSSRRSADHNSSRAGRTSAPRSATLRFASPFAPITPRVESSDDARHPRPWQQDGSGSFVAGAGSARARQRGGRRVRAAPTAPPRKLECAGRSRPRSARLWNRDRDGDCLGHRVGNVLWPEQTEANNLLKAGDPLQWPTAFGTRNEVRRRGGTKTQPAAWATNRGHNRPFLEKPEAESTPSPVSNPTQYGVGPRVWERTQHSRQWTRAMLIAYRIGVPRHLAPVPAGLGVSDSGLVRALFPLWIPGGGFGRCRVRDHAEVDWVPGLGGLIARLAPRRAGTVERARQHRSKLGRHCWESRAATLRVSRWAFSLGLVVPAFVVVAPALPRFAAHNLPGGNA